MLDEAHHGVAGQWEELVGSQPKAKLLGVTATAARLDGKGLGIHAGGLFDDLILGPKVSELVANGFLAPAICYIPAGRIDLRGVRVRGGDYETGDLERAVNAAHLTGDAVEQYALRANHLPTIAFCVQRPACRGCCPGIPGRRLSLHRLSAAEPRRPNVTRRSPALPTGETEVLCACDLISEGLDVPVLGAVIMLRPTKVSSCTGNSSAGGCAPAEGKRALIVLDHAANSLVHGLAETPVPWSLDGLKRKAKPPPTWECECGCINPAHKLVCAGCGFVREVDTPERRIVGEDAGEMLVLTPQIVAQLRSVRVAEYCAVPRTEAELTQDAHARELRPGGCGTSCASRPRYHPGLSRTCRRRRYEHLAALRAPRDRRGQVRRLTDQDRRRNRTPDPGRPPLGRPLPRPFREVAIADDLRRWALALFRLRLPTATPSRGL